jgi:hypothetical protein
VFHRKEYIMSSVEIVCTLEDSFILNEAPLISKPVTLGPISYGLLQRPDCHEIKGEFGNSCHRPQSPLNLAL